jgi:hypothetical protein
MKFFVAVFLSLVFAFCPFMHGQIVTMDGISITTSSPIDGAGRATIDGIAITGGGGGGPALVGHGFVVNTGSVNVNTVGATVTIAIVNYFTGSGTPSGPVATPAITWSSPLLITNATCGTALFYALSPATNASQNFATVGGFTSLEIVAFSGVTTFDGNSSSNGTAAGTTLLPGSVTPGEAVSLVVTAVSNWPGSGTTFSVNGGFSSNITDQIAATGSFLGGAAAYNILSSASAQNPTWTASALVNMTAVITVFH